LNQKQVIDEKNTEPNVYDFVRDQVESTNWIRNEKAYPVNGGAQNGWKNGNPSLAQRI